MSKRLKRVLAVVAVIVVCAAVAAAAYLLLSHRAGTDLDRQGTPGTAEQDSNVTLTMPNYYTSGMVLQRGKPIVIRGRTSSKVSLTITVSDGKHQSSRTIGTSSDGSFQTSLKRLPTQLKPYTLTIVSHGKVLTKIDKVYVGDVFVAAGQSNMEASYDKYYRSDEQAKANMGTTLTRRDLPETISDKHVHFIVTAARTTNDTVRTGMDLPLRSYCEDQWLSATGSRSEYLGYLPQLFAENLRVQSPNVPIGIIQTAWGGTDILPHMQGGAIYEHHIKPLEGMRIGGVLWYQGEDDAQTNDRALAYLARFTALINQYRTVFDEQDLPFLYVQLARNAGAPYTPLIRQAQSDALSMAAVIRNLGMTVSIDTDKGTSAVIHPLGKDIVATRMAKQWIAMQRQKTIPESPIAVRAVAKTGDKSKVIVYFKDGTARGLNPRNPDFSKKATADDYAESTKDTAKGFEVAGSDGKFVEAKASVNANGSSLTVSADGVDVIKQVRYQWTGVPSQRPFLYNAEGLPSSPFTLSVERHLLGPDD